MRNPGSFVPPTARTGAASAMDPGGGSSRGEEEEGASSSSLDLPRPRHEQQLWRQQQGHQNRHRFPPPLRPPPSSPNASPTSCCPSLNVQAPAFIPKVLPIPSVMIPAGHPIPLFPPHTLIAPPAHAPLFAHGGPPPSPPPLLEARIMHMPPWRPMPAPPHAAPSFLVPMPMPMPMPIPMPLPMPMPMPMHIPPAHPPLRPRHVPEHCQMQPICSGGNDDEGTERAPSMDPNTALHSTADSKPVLTDELRDTIVKQVEYYFSDSNLLTDDYLLKFVRKDPEGFVPIPIVASLRKVKMLIKNYFLLATALRNSAQLVVSDDCRKVRRLHPLPEVDLEVQSRTVVAENLAPDHSIAELEKLFGTVGNVKTVQICEPEAANSTSQTAARYPKTDMLVSNKLHALVEYESVEMAEKAVSELTDGRNWRSGLHVRLLLRRTFHNKHGHQQPSTIKGRRSSTGGGDDSGGEDDMQAVAGGLSERCEEEVTHGVENAEDILGSSGHFNEKDGTKRGRGRGRSRGRGHVQYHANNGRTHPVGAPLYTSSNASIEMKPTPGPRMPDGTRGFTMGRGKLPMENDI